MSLSLCSCGLPFSTPGLDASYCQKCRTWKPHTDWVAEAQKSNSKTRKK